MIMQKTLDIIGRAESNNDPNAVWGGIPKHLRPGSALGKEIAECTAEEVLAWQKSIRAQGVRSTACGEFQFIFKTLRGLVKNGDVETHALFNEEAQRAAALALMDGRGLEDCAAGKLSVDDFLLNISKEWASLPVPYDIERRGRTIKRGMSYWSGLAGNKSLVSVEDLEAAVRMDLGLAIPAQPIAPMHTSVQAQEKSIAQPVERPSPQDEGFIDEVLEQFKFVASQNKDMGFRLLKKHLKSKGSKTVVNGDRTRLLGASAGGVGAIGWLTNLLSEDALPQLSGYVSLARDHAFLIIAILGFAVLFFAGKIIHSRIEDSVSGIHKGAGGKLFGGSDD